jgi:HK97 family phage major capsid protein
LNSRLSLFVTLEEERQVLRGSGTNELVGIFGRSISSYARGTVDSNATALFKAAMGLRGSAHLDADGVVMHPSNWQTTRLLQDSAGQYMGGGPFTSAYGGVQGQVTAFTGASLWGLPVYLSTVVGAGTALVGSFGQAAALWRRGGVTVEATNSHASQFVQNLMTIRAESRLALAVYRPSAFVAVTGMA